MFSVFFFFAQKKKVKNRPANFSRQSPILTSNQPAVGEPRAHFLKRMHFYICLFFVCLIILFFSSFFFFKLYFIFNF